MGLDRQGHILVDPGQAARGEPAAGRQVDEIRDVAGDDRQRFLRVADDRDRADEPPRVRVERRSEERSDIRLLDDLAGVHDGHPVAHLGDHAQVVGDQDDRRPGLVAELAHQVEDLGLDGDVESRRGFVGDEQVRLAGERHGDHHPLGHAARELVRERLESPFRVRDTDQSEQLEGPTVGGVAGHLAMQLENLADLPVDVPDRVQR